MIANDMQFLVPDENGRRVCEMALSSFSAATVALADAHAAAAGPGAPAPTFSAAVPEATRARIMQLGADLAACADNVESVPPHLDLSGPRLAGSEETGPDPALVQSKDHLMWDVEENVPDPGQSVTLRKYDPVDMLQLPEKVLNLHVFF